MYTYFNAFHQHANTEIHTLTAKDDFRIVEVSGSNPLCSTKMPEIVEFTTFSGIFVAIYSALRPRSQSVLYIITVANLG